MSPTKRWSHIQFETTSIYNDLNLGPTNNVPIEAHHFGKSRKGRKIVAHRGSGGGIDCGKIQPRRGGTMAHSYARNHIHLVFSTKERQNTIPKEMQPKLWAYIAGI